MRVYSSFNPSLATLYELEEVYNTSALYDFLEFLDFKESLTQAQQEDEKAIREQAQQQNSSTNMKGRK